MTRSGRWPRRRRSAWRRTAPTDRWQHGSLTNGPTQLRPVREGDLSEGVVVQAQLLGRVLGLRLLRVDGTVLLAPASTVSVPHGDPRVYADGELAEAARLLRQSEATLRSW